MQDISPRDTGSEFRDSRVMITGGRGFIGQALSQRLVAAGANVITVGRTSGNGNEAGEAIVCDLVDPVATQILVRDVNPDVVFHLASLARGAREPEVVLSTLHNNTTSTVNLLLAALEQKCERVILTGSLEEPEPDGSWPVPSSPYAAAKLAAGSYGRMFAALYDLPVTSLRVFMVYGPGRQDEAKLVPYVINCLLRGEAPKLGEGSRLVDWVFIDDVVDAYLRAAVAKDVIGLSVDAGTGALTSVRDVVQQIFILMGADDSPVMGALQARQLEQVRNADLAKAQALTGWQPRHSLEQGLSATIEYFKGSLN